MSDTLTCPECGAKLVLATAEPDAAPECPNGHELPDPLKIQT